MSDGNTGRFDKALVGAILTAIALVGMYWAMFYDAGYQSGRHQERAQIERKHYAADTSKRVESECSGKLAVALRECVAEIVTSEHENKRNESDLAAQWQAADWVFWASIIAGAQLVATVIGLYFIKGTLDATSDAVSETGKATNAMVRQNELAEAAQRPWISVDCEVSIYERDGPVATIKYTAFITNQGKMAARNFCAIVRCKFFNIDDVDTKIPDWFETERRKRKRCKHVLIPGERGPYDGESRQRIDMIAHRQREVPDTYYVVILVSVQYQTFAGDEWHSTERSFCVGMKDADIFNEQTMSGLLPDGIYSKEIAVRRFRSGLTT